MTSGIYIISSPITDKVYIGQSSNIEDRWTRHKRDLSKNTHHSYKLQEAYNSGLIFEYSILEVSTDSLDEKEVYYIKEFDSYYNGYNCTTAISVTGSGYDSSNAVYNKETYIQIVNYLAYTSMTIGDIVKELQVSKNIVENISTLRRHSWIEAEMPLEYDILLAKRLASNTRPRGSNPDIEKVFKELIYGTNSIQYILDNYSLSMKQIQHMCYGTCYTWLKTIYPLEYPILKASFSKKCKK